MVKRCFGLLLLAVGLSVSVHAQSYHLVTDCQYDTDNSEFGCQTSWQCEDIATYCDGLNEIGSSIDYSYRRCYFPSCGAFSPGLKQCYHTASIEIDYTCGGSDQCEPCGYLNGGYTKITCTITESSYAYYDCCDCSQYCDD